MALPCSLPSQLTSGNFALPPNLSSGLGMSRFLHTLSCFCWVSILTLSLSLLFHCCLHRSHPGRSPQSLFFFLPLSPAQDSVLVCAAVMGYCEVEGEVWPAFLFFKLHLSLHFVSLLFSCMYAHCLCAQCQRATDPSFPCSFVRMLGTEPDYCHG